MIIGLTGLPASGKGTTGAYLIQNYDAQAIRFSDPLRDIIHRVYHEQTRESMSHLAQFLRGEFGNDILIQTLLKDIEKSDKKLFVLDGMRYPEEYGVLAQRKDFVMWALDADFEKRYVRIVSRDENRSDKALTQDQFQKQHELQTERFIPELMQKADARIVNNETIEELYTQIDALVKKFIQ